MIFEMKRTVRCSQIGENGFMRNSAVVDLLQDCSLEHLDNEPVMTPFFKENNCIMFLISRQIDILRKPYLSEKLSVKTWCYELNRLYGFRNTVIYDENGNTLVKSIAGGCFINSQTMQTMKVSQEMIQKVQTHPKLDDMCYLPRKITLPNVAPQTFAPVKINRCFIDMNNHVNNARYLDITDEFIDTDYVKQIRLEYKTPIQRESIVIPKVYKGTSTLAVGLISQDDKAYATVEYTF